MRERQNVLKTLILQSEKICIYILIQALKDVFKGGFPVLSKCSIMETLQILHLTLMTCCQISALSQFKFFSHPY